MGLKIDRKSGYSQAKCILHRVADIPGGVAISVSSLGHPLLREGTPIGVGADGLYRVCKTAELYEDATNASQVVYKLAKGHQFRVGDMLALEGVAGKRISEIVRHASCDWVQVEKTFGKTLNKGQRFFESEGETETHKVIPTAVVGETHEASRGENLWVSAWVIGVLREDASPAVDDTTKAHLKGIVYV